MQFRLQLIVVADDGVEQVEEILGLERGEATAATLGLTVAEGKGAWQRMCGIVR